MLKSASQGHGLVSNLELEAVDLTPAHLWGMGDDV